MFRISMLKSFVFALATLLCIIAVPESYARPNASIKFSVLREENPKTSKETLILPYGFPSDAMGTTFGVGGMTKGYLQDQLLLGGTVFGSFDSAAAIFLGLWDYKLPATDRLFFSVLGSVGDYPRLRAYTETPGGFTGIKAGSNDSDKENYIEDSGTDNWWEMKIEFVLPFGSMKDHGMASYKLKHGMIVGGATGGESWNPLKSGGTVMVLRQFNRYQNFETKEGNINGAVHPLELGLLYNNTDYPSNPSTGSSQYLSVIHDFGWLESNETWTFLEFEASKYFSLGETDLARQQVVAFNFWTGYSPSWETTVDGSGAETISSKPPYLEGAKLGGFYRMRAYPNNRFNDKSVIYTTAEYRFTPRWNPIGETHWLRWLKMDWMQFVAFAEGGRVANEYEFSELFSDWKVDGGLGLRAMVAGAVVRLDFAASEEGSAMWVMFGHPF